VGLGQLTLQVIVLAIRVVQDKEVLARIELKVVFKSAGPFQPWATVYGMLFVSLFCKMKPYRFGSRPEMMWAQANSPCRS
jgi:hypothetical protein